MASHTPGPRRTTLRRAFERAARRRARRPPDGPARSRRPVRRRSSSARAMRAARAMACSGRRPVGEILRRRRASASSRSATGSASTGSRKPIDRGDRAEHVDLARARLVVERRRPAQRVRAALERREDRVLRERRVVLQHHRDGARHDRRRERRAERDAVQRVDLLAPVVAPVVTGSLPLAKMLVGASAARPAATARRRSRRPAP